MTTNLIEQLSTALADRVALAAPTVVAIRTGRRQASGIVWRPDVVIASEQTLGDDPALSVMHGGQRIGATLAGRDAGTNVASAAVLPVRARYCRTTRYPMA